MELRSDLKIILQNVNTWTKSRGNELSNYYNREQPDVILINDIGTNSNVKIFNNNVHVKNFQNEKHAGVAIAIRKDGVLRKLKHIFPNTYQRIKSICSPAKGGTGCYRFNYQPGS